jgi:hypothetical protein
METYVSVISWAGYPPLEAGDVRAAVRRQDRMLRARGLHSVVFLPDGGVCSAVMVSTVRDDSELEPLVAAIVPDVHFRIDSMRFDDDPASPVWVDASARRPVRPDGYLSAVLEAVSGE